MKRFHCFGLIWGLALLLTACGPVTDIVSCPAAPEETTAPEDDVSTMKTSPAPEPLSLRIVDGAETGQLVLAGKEADQVYTLNVGDTPVYLEGEEADASALEDGMAAELQIQDAAEAAYGPLEGVVSISVHSLGSLENPSGSFYDLCGFYLQVLNDLWETDSGLNDGVSYISLDLSKAPGGLTDGEQVAVAQTFASSHGAEALTLTMEELAEQGYLTDGAWADGLLFTITPAVGAEGEAYSLPVLRFDAGKWRSPLGAYYFSDCTAVWPELGTWDSYTVGAQAIS